VTRPSIPEGLAPLRAGFIDTLWRGMFWIALIGGPLSVSRALITGWLPLYTGQLLTAALMMGIAVLRHRLNERWKAGLFLIVLWLIGVPGLVSLGLAAASVWWLVLSGFVASTLYSVRVGGWLAVATGLALAFTALGHIAGVLSFPADFASYHRQPGPWLALILISGAFAYFMLRAVGAYNQAVLELLDREARQRQIAAELYENAPCGYHTLDAEGRITRINRTERDWLGEPAERLIGTAFRDWLTPEAQLRWDVCRTQTCQELELALHRAQAPPLPVLLHTQTLHDGSGRQTGSRSTLIDLTERKALEARIEALARIDPLTGTCNRRAFQALAETTLARAERSGEALALLMIDVDHFKAINDRFGHAGGDAVLRELAEQLRAGMRGEDVLARVGGEEFVLLLPATPPAQALALAERLRTYIGARTLVLADGGLVQVTVSMGLAAHRPGLSLDGLLRAADIALYAAKAQGRNRVVPAASLSAAAAAATPAPASSP
jgi:diguanylate cyclase (GGDEF)-like protein/PAS domain S-box-containing protein